MKQVSLVCVPLVLVAFALAGCGGSGATKVARLETANVDFPLAAEAASITRRWVQRADAPGAVVAVGLPDGSIWQTAVGIAQHQATTKEMDVAYGDSALNAGDGVIPWQGRAMDPSLLLRIGSRTKTYTAALMLKLREQGLVNFDATVDSYLTPGLVPNGDRVKVRQLLDMTAGIEDFLASFSPYDLSKPATFEQILSYTRSLPNKGIYSQPGAGVYYSNTNYIIAGMIAEKVTGKKYKQLMEENILTPLGLRSTQVPDPDSTVMPGPNAHGYKVDLPWDVWDALWNAQWATSDEVMTYLLANPGLVDAFAAQDSNAMGSYEYWVVRYLKSNTEVALAAYLQIHPDLIAALQAYKNGDQNALSPYPAPLVGMLTTTEGLIDQILGRRRGRKSGVTWRDCTDIYTSAVGPVGGVVSTAADQVRWIRALEMGNFLSTDSTALRDNAWQPYPYVSDATWNSFYGFGVYKKVQRATGNVFIGHGGRLEGYDSYGYLWKDHGYVVVVLVNGLNLNLRELDAGYPSGSIAGNIGQEIFDKITAAASGS